MGKKKGNAAELSEEEKAEENNRIWDEIYYYQGKVEEYTEKRQGMQFFPLEAPKRKRITGYSRFEDVSEEEQ